MAFTYPRPTDDAFAAAPDGFGFCTIAFDIANTGGSTGGDMVLPFTSKEDIEIVGWTPVATGAYPFITATAYDTTTGLPQISITFAANAVGRLRLRGRGGS